MSATAELRALCDPSPKELRQALLAYSKNSRRAPAGITEDPNLYTDLVHHYLAWSAELLTAMEGAAAARPAAKGAVDRLVELAHAYFHAESRWPSAAHLGPPLNLLIPAYYTVRSAQEINYSLQPELLRLDLAEAHEFVVEILGHALSDKICQQKNADLKTLAKISEETPPAVEPLPYRAFLRAAQRKRLAKARTPKPALPPPPAPVAPPPVTIDQEKILAVTWSLDLSDKRIVLERTNSFESGSFSSREVLLDLRRGHRFRLLESSRMRISGTDLENNGLREIESEGEWKIEVLAEKPLLVLLPDEGGRNYYFLGKRGRNFVTLDRRERAWQSL